METDLTKFGIESHWQPKAEKPKTLLVVYAHPDDESFGNGGTIARYAHSGYEVHYICGTRGEVGTVDPKHLAGFADVSELRTAELLCAAQALGLRGVHFLGYRDSGMPGAPENQHPNALAGADLEKVSEQVVALMRTLRPEVVLTFGAFGGYGHPDHIMMHRAAVAAFRDAADPQKYPEAGEVWQASKLYYSTVTPGLLKVAVPLLRLLRKDPTKFGENNDVDLVAARDALTPITTVVDCGAFIEQKEKAWQCHQSQAGGMTRFQKAPLAVRRLLFGKEQFTRIIPAWQPGAAKETDLFAGV